LRLGESYSVATEEAKAYEKALESGNGTLIYNAEGALRNAIKINEAAD
jgi:hypothetical protein